MKTNKELIVTNGTQTWTLKQDLLMIEGGSYSTVIDLSHVSRFQIKSVSAREEGEITLWASDQSWNLTLPIDQAVSFRKAFIG